MFTRFSALMEGRVSFQITEASVALCGPLTMISYCYYVYDLGLQISLVCYIDVSPVVILSVAVKY